MTPPAPVVVLFDGVCSLCNGFVDFAIARDPRGRLRFGALQSEAGQRALREAGVDAPPLSTLVVLEGGKAHVRSDAALRALSHLRFPWPLLFAAVVVPRPLRDALYDFVAARRYRWFGRSEACRLPSPEERSRFLT
jgi:predicted DCC family thiol-disulfide oxidoreductase YuxK